MVEGHVGLVARGGSSPPFGIFSSAESKYEGHDSLHWLARLRVVEPTFSLEVSPLAPFAR